MIRTCSPYFWFSAALVLVGIVMFLIRRRAPTPETVGARRRFSLLQLIGILFFILGVGLYATAVAAYPACTSSPGACPAGFPPGSTGYFCTNEYTQCSWTGNCLTVAGSLPWDSACECKCTR